MECSPENYSRYNILFYNTETKSTLIEILKCHDIEYIEKLKNSCKALINPNDKYNDLIEEEIIVDSNLYTYIETKEPDPNKKEYEKLDIDTYINWYSYENIYNTTGCVFKAIDLIIGKQVTNAIALVRPQGNQIGYYGPAQNPFKTSLFGFCLVKNVAIGAAYAKYKYRNTISRIAIIDFDLHHGNGTEEIIRMLMGKGYSEYALSKNSDSFVKHAKKRINWLNFDDPKNVLFVSTHLYDEKNKNKIFHYTGSVETNTKEDDEYYPGGILNVPFDKSNNIDYCSVFELKIIPRLRIFKPDLIFISAGFDVHKSEKINRGFLQLDEFDFAYITQQIQLVANEFSEGRVVSVLEGGYNTSSGIISFFAQSIFTHVRFLNSSINMLYYDDKYDKNLF